MDHFHECLVVAYPANLTLILEKHPDEQIQSALRQKPSRMRYYINGAVERELFFDPFQGDYGNTIMALSKMGFAVVVKRLRVIPDGVRLLHTTKIKVTAPATLAL